MDGEAYAYTWHSNGDFLQSMHSAIDLINTPERVTRWIGVYGPDMISGAGSYRLQDWKQCIELTFEDGKLIETKIHEE